MKLQEMIAKLRSRRFTLNLEFQDMDQAGDLLLAAALAISAGIVAMIIAGAPAVSFVPAIPAKLVFM